MRADQVLPDSVNEVDVHGTTVRKGTVAAFLVNARVWSDPHADEPARAQAAADIVGALPALRALGLFDVFEVRDPALRAWLDARSASAHPHTGEVR